MGRFSSLVTPNTGSIGAVSVGGGSRFSSLLSTVPPLSATPLPPSPSDDGFFTSAWDGFLESLSSTPETGGEFLEALGRTAGSDFLQRKGRELQTPDPGEAAPTPRRDLFDSETFGEFKSSLGRMFGEGMGSTLPSMVMGGAGAAAGAVLGAPGGPPGIAAGALTGGRLAAAPASYVMNAGDLYRALKEEGADPDTAAGWAMAAGIPIAALDVYSLGVFTESARRAVFGEVAKQIVKDGGVANAITGFKGIVARVLRDTGKGAAVEAGPEALQQVIQEATVAGVTDKPLFTAERARKVALAGIGGALVGGAIGGGGQALAEARGRGVPPAPAPTVESEPAPIPVTDETGTADPGLAPSEAELSELRQAMVAKGVPEPRIEELLALVKVEGRGLYDRLRQNFAAPLRSEPTLTPEDEEAITASAANLTPAPELTPFLENAVELGVPASQVAGLDQTTLRTLMALRREVDAGNQGYQQRADDLGQQLGLWFDVTSQKFVAGEAAAAPAEDTGETPTSRKQREELRDAAVAGQQEIDAELRQGSAVQELAEIRASRRAREELTQRLKESGLTPWEFVNTYFPERGDFARMTSEDVDSAHGVLDALAVSPPPGLEVKPPKPASAKARGKQAKELQRAQGRQRQTEEKPGWQEELPMREPLASRTFAEDDYSEAALIQPVAKMSLGQLRTALEKIPAPKPADKGKTGWRLQRRADALSAELRKRIIGEAAVGPEVPPSRSPVPTTPTVEPAEVDAEAEITPPEGAAERRFVYRSDRPRKNVGLGWRVGASDVEVIDDHTFSVGQILSPDKEQFWGLTLQETVNVPLEPTTTPEPPAAPPALPAVESRPAEEPEVVEPAPALVVEPPAPVARSFRNDPALKRYVLDAGPAAELDRTVVAELRDAGYKWNPKRGAWLAMPTPVAQSLGERLSDKPMSAGAPASEPTPERMSLFQVARGALAPTEIRRIVDRVGSSDDVRVQRKDYFRKLMSKAGVTMEDFISEALAHPEHGAVLRAHGITDDSSAMVDKLAGILSNPDETRRPIPISDRARTGETTAAEGVRADDERQWLRETLVETKDLRGRLATITDQDELEVFSNEYVEALGKAGSIGWGPKKVESQTQAVLDAVRQRSVELAQQPKAEVVAPAVEAAPPAPAGPTQPAAVSTPAAKESESEVEAEPVAAEEPEAAPSPADADALIESYRDGSRNLGSENVADLDAALLPAFIAEAQREREMLVEGRDALADRDDLPQPLVETLRKNATDDLARVDRQIADAERRLTGGGEGQQQEPAVAAEPEAEPAAAPSFSLEQQSGVEPARKPALEDQPLGLDLPKRVLPGTARKAEGRGLEGAALSEAGEAEAAAEASRAQEELSFEPQADETPEDAAARQQAEADMREAGQEPEAGLPGVREEGRQSGEYLVVVSEQNPEEVKPKEPQIRHTLETASADPERDYRGAGRVENGELVTWHSTSNPSKTANALNRKDDVAKWGNEFDDLGQGFYASDAPHYWKGRDTSRLAYLENLTPEQTEILAQEVERRLDEGRESGYMTDTEYGYGQRAVKALREGNNYIQTLAGQPWNIPLGSKGFIESLGFEPTEQGGLIEVRLKGKFAELVRSNLTRGEKLWLQQHGYDGAYTPAGFSSQPQLVLWNAGAVQSAMPARITDSGRVVTYGSSLPGVSERGAGTDPVSRMVGILRRQGYEVPDVPMPKTTEGGADVGRGEGTTETSMRGAAIRPVGRGEAAGGARGISPISDENRSTISQELTALSGKRGEDGILREGGDTPGRRDGNGEAARSAGTEGAHGEKRNFWDQAKAEWRSRGYIDLSDKVIGTLADIAAIAQVFRDPRVEHSRVVYVGANSGKVLAHEGFTSRIADAAPSPLYAGHKKGRALQETKDANIKKIAKRISRLSERAGEPVMVVPLHNHPSGNSTPSDDDVVVLHDLMDNLPPSVRVPGMVIINTGEFSVVWPSGVAATYNTETNEEIVAGEGEGRIAANKATDSLFDAMRKQGGKNYGLKIYGASSVATLGKELKAPENFVSLIYLNVNGIVQGHESVPLKEFGNPRQAIGFLKHRLAAFGSSGAVMYYEGDAASQDQIFSIGKFLGKLGLVYDAVYLPAGSAPHKAVSGKKKGDVKKADRQDLSIIRTAEAGTPYDAASDAGATTPEQVELAKAEWLAKGTDSRWFRRWFGESKAVDEAGKPLVLYHGTEKKFSVFDPTKIGSFTGVKSEAFWFTDSEYAAGYYSSGTRKAMAIYLRMENPLRVTEEQFRDERRGPSSWARLAKELGHDGVIIENIQDGDVISTVYAVFDPTAAKSVGNRGTFSESDPNILREKGEPYDPDTFDPKDPEQAAQLLREVFGEEDAQWYLQRHKAAVDAAVRGEEPPAQPPPTPAQKKKVQDAGRAVVEVLNPRPRESQWEDPRLQAESDKIDQARRDSNDPGKLMAQWGEDDSFAEQLRRDKFIAPASRLARWLNGQFWTDKDATILAVKAQAAFRNIPPPPPSVDPWVAAKQYEQVQGKGDNIIDLWGYTIKEGWFTRKEAATKKDILNAQLTPEDKGAIDLYFRFRLIVAREKSLVARHERRVAERKDEWLKKQAADLRKRGFSQIDIAAEMPRLMEGDLAKKEFAKEKYQPIDIRKLNPGDGKGKGMIAAEAQELIDSMEKELGPERFGRLQRAEHNVAKVFRLLLREAVEAETISQKTYDALIADQKKHGDYLGPFVVIEHMMRELDKGNHLSSGLNVEYQDQVLTREGTNSEVMPITDATPRKIYAMTGLNARNRAMKAWYDMRNFHDDWKDLVRDLPVKEVTEEGTKIFYTPEEMGWAGFTQLSFLGKGEAKHFAMPDQFASVLLALDKQQQGVLLKAMSWMGNAMRYGATGGNPTFAITQVPQDFLSQRLAADDPLKFLNPKDWKLMWNALQTGLFQVGMGAKMGPGGVQQRRRYRKLRDAGAAYTGFHQQNRPTQTAGEALMGLRNTRKERVATADKEKNPWIRNFEKMKAGGSWGWETTFRIIGTPSSATEYMTRMAVFEKNEQSLQYKRLKAAWDELPMDARSTKGRDLAEVQADLRIYKEKNPGIKIPPLAPIKDETLTGFVNGITSTIDFREIGATMRVLTQLAPFTASRMGAARTFIQGAKKNRARAMALGVAYMTLEASLRIAGWVMFGSLMLDLDKKEEADKYILPVGVNTDDDGNDHPIHFRVSKDSFGKLVTAPVRELVDYWFTKDLKVGAAVADMVSAISPIDIAWEGDVFKTAGRSALLLAPPVVQGVFEVGAGPRGYDFYRQRELMTEEQATRKPHERYNAYSSYGSLVISRMLADTPFAVAPLKVDHLVQKTFGSLSADFMRIADYLQIVDPPMGTREKNWSEEISSFPIARGFYSVRGGNRQRLEHLALDEVQIEVGSWAFGNRKWAQEFLEMPIEGKRKRLVELRNDPDKFKALQNLMKKEALGRGSVETRLGTFGQENGARALAIAYLFNNSLLTAAERVTFIAKHAQGKTPLVTPLVYRQLVMLMNKGVIAPAQADYNLHQKEQSK